MFCKNLELEAPCKINLHLNVGGRRKDGFHAIESVFQLISLSDELSVSVSGGNGELRVFCPDTALPEENTVTKAVRAFRAETGIQDGVEIHLVKNVPSGAGLGGGSSDGAAILCALNRIFSAGLTQEKLETLALQVGSDAPFFVSGKPAFVAGRGERIRPLPGSPAAYPGVLIWPGVHSGTAEAYALLDAAVSADAGAEGRADAPVCRGTGGDAEEDVFARLSAQYALPPEKWAFFNSFTPVVAGKYPQIRAALADIRESGARFSEMSGSGSSVFGIFANKEESERAFRLLSAKWRHCYPFFLLAFSPVSPHN